MHRQLSRLNAGPQNPKPKPKPKPKTLHCTVAHDPQGAPYSCVCASLDSHNLFNTHALFPHTSHHADRHTHADTHTHAHTCAYTRIHTLFLSHSLFLPLPLSQTPTPSSLPPSFSRSPSLTRARAHTSHSNQQDFLFPAIGARGASASSHVSRSSRPTTQQMSFRAAARDTNNEQYVHTLQVSVHAHACVCARTRVCTCVCVCCSWYQQ